MLLKWKQMDVDAYGIWRIYLLNVGIKLAMWTEASYGVVEQQIKGVCQQHFSWFEFGDWSLHMLVCFAHSGIQYPAKVTQKSVLGNQLQLSSTQI